MKNSLSILRQLSLMACLISLFSSVFLSANAHYSLYYSDLRRTSYPTFDCLYAYVIDSGKETGSRYIRNHYLIPYCRRPDPDDNHDTDEIDRFPRSGDNIVHQITFDDLKKQGIKSEQLLSWLAPIDVAERYEMNVNNFDTFYLCQSPWFGNKCQYRLDEDTDLSFGDYVQATFNDYTHITRNHTQGTCYRFLEGCNDQSWPFCLDWRNICDGKTDCFHGEDEQWCSQLIFSRCQNDEYRCHYGGQCIPKSFLKDNRLSIDCLDGSDENDFVLAYSPLMNPQCPEISTFRCQERMARYVGLFQCGDGQYLQSFHIPTRLPLCSNNRDKEISRLILTAFDHIHDKQCQQAFYCALYSNRTNEQSQINKLKST